ncbi:YjdF family protein [Olsenella sp. Marseille-P4559]|uniref:YjdF family protein n=1 Tax=Olsenella sp. Marseille-P4559 TaxID=2364795 RepID=UPI0010310339|nr:YjdF family protein [Olsenella sp. Marseille-P4559]
MERSSITLTVLFDAPFWVGVFERVENGRLAVAKVTFGAEPKDYEVRDFVLGHFYDLKFSPAVAAEEHHTSENLKRRQRAA